MPSATHFVLRGDKELVKNLAELGSPAQLRSAGRKALDAGGGVIKRAVVANVAEVKDTGLLAKSIKVRHAKPKYKTSIMATVGPTHMKRMMRRTKKGTLRQVSKGKVAEWQAKGEKLIPYDPGNYGHLVERGTKPHFIGVETKKALSFGGGHPIRGGVWHLGFKGLGFMRRAVDSQGRAAQAKVSAKLWEEIKKKARTARFKW